MLFFDYCREELGVLDEWKGFQFWQQVPRIRTPEGFKMNSPG